jgi:serine/threonine-protein kinase
VELDAGSVSARRSLAACYYYARRWDQAIYHFERGIAMNPTAEETYRMLGLTLAVSGRPDDAIGVLAETAAMPDAGTYTRASLGYALARAGRREDAKRIFDELAASVAAGQYVSPVAFATILVGLGDVDGALDWTERAFEDRRGWLVYLGVNPVLDPMRGHPRFEALVRRMRPQTS